MTTVKLNPAPTPTPTPNQVLCKADTMTTVELKRFRREVAEALSAAGVQARRRARSP